MKKYSVVLLLFTLLFSILKAFAGSSFCGIGASLYKTNQYSDVFVKEVYENSPAAKSGLKAQDRILKINGKETCNLSLEQAVNLIKGEKGTTVKLTVSCENGLKDYIVAKDNFKVPLSAYAPKWEEFCPQEYMNSEYHDISSIKNARKKELIEMSNYWAIRKGIFEKEVGMCSSDTSNQTNCYMQIRQLETNKNLQLQNEFIAKQQANMQVNNNLQRLIQTQQLNNGLYNINTSLNGINTNLMMLQLNGR